MQDIRTILFPTLYSFRFVGIKHRKKIIHSKEQILAEIDRRVEIARNHNRFLFDFYWRIMENSHL